MEELLAPWLALADVVYPAWRSVVHGGNQYEPELGLLHARARTFVLQTTPASGRSLFNIFNTRDTALNAAQQLQLREVLEVLALAVRVDARKCVVLACEGESHRSPLTSEPFGPFPWTPRLHVHASASPKLPATADFNKAFFSWNEETASEAFKQSKDALAALPGRTVDMPGPRFELVLDLKLRCRNQDFKTLHLAHMIQLLQGIDRKVFRVVRITLTIKHSKYETAELTELFRLIHGFHDDASVQIRLQMCQDKEYAVCLHSWKLIFDLVARKTFPNSPIGSDSSRKRPWDLDVMCGGPGLDNTPECGRDRWHVLTDARLVAACFSALAHAGDHVTSIRLINPLEDRTSDYRHPRDRDRRAEWLGYLLRVGVVEKLHLDEGELTGSDIREIRNILRATTQDECFAMLWKLWWHRPLEEEYGYEDPNYQHIDDTARFVNDPSEVLGVMRPSRESERADEAVANSSFVDVFLVGYGQCSIPRSLAETMTEEPNRMPERRSRLKSLSLHLSENGRGLFPSIYDRPDTSLLELLSLVGKNLEELTVHGSRMPISFLVRVLHMCPQLRRLDVKLLHLEPTDEKQRVPRSSGRCHPLRELILGIQLDEQSSGLRVLSKWLMWFGVELRELRIRAKEPHQPLSKSSLPTVERMLRTCCQSCSIIELSGLAVDYFRAMFKKRGAVAFPHVAALILNSAVWTEASWTSLLTALSTPTNALARSLHTLAIRSFNLDRSFDEEMATMLEKNHLLVKVRYITRGSEDSRVSETNGIESKRLKTPFAMRHKASLLSVIETSPLPWESFVISNIFQFVREYEIRRVLVS